MLTLDFQENIFKSKIFLSLHDKEILKKINEKKFNFFKYLTFLFFLLIFSIINIFFFNYFNTFPIIYKSFKSENRIGCQTLNYKEINNYIFLEKKQYYLLMISFIFNISFIFLLVIEYFFKIYFKKFQQYLYITTTIFIITNFFLQVELSKLYVQTALQNIIEDNYFYSFLFLEFFLNIFRIFYFDNTFILNSVSTLISFGFFIFLNLWKIKNSLNILISIFIYLFWCFITYKLDKLEKSIFVLFQKTNSSLTKTKMLLDNLSSGIVLIKSNKILDFNSKINEIGNFRRSNTKNFETNFNSLEIKNFIFTGLMDFNNKLEINLIENFKKLNKILSTGSFPTEKDYELLMKDLLSNSKFFSDYEFIAKKSFTKKGLHKKGELTFQIFIKYNEVDETFEILVNDISSIIKNEELNAQNKYKKIFLNKFSHEFKNPILNVSQLIKDFTNLIKRINKDFGKNTFQQKDNWEELILKGTELKHVQNLCNYMTTLITDFDILANIDLVPGNPENPKERGKTGLNKFITIYKDQVNLRKIIKFCFNIFTTRIELNERNIDLQYMVDDTIPEYIISDERRLKQILINLISNSYKFTNNGFIMIKVTKSDEDPLQINFIVEDSGNGIKNEILANICEPFKKIDTDTNIYGAGLGLYIVKRLVEELGSDLVINSEVQKGTKISFLINISDNEDDLNTINENITNVDSTINQGEAMPMYKVFPIKKNNQKNAKCEIKLNEEEKQIKNFIPKNGEINFTVPHNLNNKSYTLNIFKKNTRLSDSFSKKDLRFRIREKRNGSNPSLNSVEPNVKKSITDMGKLENLVKNRLNITNNQSLNSNHKFGNSLSQPTQNIFNTTITNNNKNQNSMNLFNIDKTTSIAVFPSAPNNMSETICNTNPFNTGKFSNRKNEGYFKVNNQDSNISDITVIIDSPKFKLDYEKYRKLTKVKSNRTLSEYNDDKNNIDYPNIPNNNKIVETTIFPINKLITFNQQNCMENILNCKTFDLNVDKSSTNTKNQNFNDIIDKETIENFTNNNNTINNNTKYLYEKSTNKHLNPFGLTNNEENNNLKRNYTASSFFINEAPDNSAQNIDSSLNYLFESNDNRGMEKHDNIELIDEKNSNCPYSNGENNISNINKFHEKQPEENGLNNRIFRVLLVDDERLIRQSEVTILKKYFNKFKDKFTDIEIVECIDGVECLYEIWLNLQEGIKFDAVITDQSMNFMRGSLLAQIIRNLISENVIYEMKIFMVTSYEPHIITNTVGNVLDEIYTKPLSYDSIRRICNRY